MGQCARPTGCPRVPHAPAQGGLGCRQGLEGCVRIRVAQASCVGRVREARGNCPNACIPLTSIFMASSSLSTRVSKNRDSQGQWPQNASSLGQCACPAGWPRVPRAPTQEGLGCRQGLEGWIWIRVAQSSSVGRVREARGNCPHARISLMSIFMASSTLSRRVSKLSLIHI